MKWKVNLDPEAAAEFAEAKAYYESAREGYGLVFHNRVKQILERLETMPELYGTIWKQVRSARVRQFQHVIYYMIVGDSVEVFAILHGSRAATQWKKRVPSG